MIKVGVITISDRSFRGERKDESGPALIELVKEHFKEVSIKYELVPDEKDMIKEKLITMVDYMKLDLILTTGGTGVSLRDVTPEATIEIAEKEVPGFAEAMRFNSLKITPNAMLSRAKAVLREKTLIINLPGSPKAVKECFNVIIPAIPHALEVIKSKAKE